VSRCSGCSLVLYLVLVLCMGQQFRRVCEPRVRRSGSSSASTTLKRAFNEQAFGLISAKE
jgi:hypothetical protein